MKPKSWAGWGLTFLCACSAAVPPLAVRGSEAVDPAVLVIRPGGYRPVELSREQFREGMRRLASAGPLPGAPRRGAPRVILVSADPGQRLKAVEYLQFCEGLTGERKDCWEVLTAAGEMDHSGEVEIALRFAFSEALEDAAKAIGSITPEQVRAILSLTILGTIVELLSPEPVSKFLFVVTATNLIAFVGVDLFNNIVKGYLAMADELKLAHDFAEVRAAGLRYGERIGPTLGRIVVMVATYGVAKAAGLFKGSAGSLSGGAPAVALAEAQGFQIPAVEGATSIALATDGAVTVHLGTAMAMSAYERARAGGAHAGTLKNYEGRSLVEIERAIRSYERQVALHAEKIADPSKYVERWAEMSAQEQVGLLNKWRADMARNQELADVLRGLANSKR